MLNKNGFNKMLDNQNNNKLNLDGQVMNMKNPLKRIIETAFAAKINGDNISKRLKDASIKKFRDGLKHLDFLRIDRNDLVQYKLNENFPNIYINEN